MPLQVLAESVPSGATGIWRAWPMLSAKIVAQKPSGRVMPAASPLQLVAAAWVGSVADHDIRVITTATRRLRGPDHRTIGLVDDKYVHSIVHLCLVQTFRSTPPKPPPWPQPLPQPGASVGETGPRLREVGFVLDDRQRARRTRRRSSKTNP